MGDLQAFVETLFRADESACYAALARGTTVFPVDEPPQWVQFFSINPLYGDIDLGAKAPPGKGRRADVNVSAHRNFLVEIDSMPLEEQREYVESLGLPWSTCVHSGGKSLHFIVALTEDVGEAEYRRLASRLLSVVSKADQSTKNPSRLSRFPGVTRRDKGTLQELIEVRCPVTHDSFLSWLNRVGEGPAAEVTDIVGVSLADIEPGQRGLLWPTTYQFLREEAPPGFRNRYLFMAACDFHEQNYSIEEALTRLRKASTLDGMEFAETVRSAFERAPKYGVRTWGLKFVQRVS